MWSRGGRRGLGGAEFDDGGGRPELEEAGSGRRCGELELDSSEEKGHGNTAEAMERSAGLGEARSGGGERRPEVREMGSGRRTTGPGLNSSEEKGHGNTAEAMERSAGLGEARSGGAVRRRRRLGFAHGEEEEGKESSGEGSEGWRARWGRLLALSRAQKHARATARREGAACFTMAVTGRRKCREPPGVFRKFAKRPFSIKYREENKNLGAFP